MATTAHGFQLVWHGEAVKARMDVFAPRYLKAAGELVASEAARNAHERTGKLRRSVHYAVRSPSGVFFPSDAPDRKEDGRMAAPTEPNTVKTGTSLFYGLFHEKLVGWLSRAGDTSISGLRELSETIAQEVFE
jgi:hypothetical protein